MKLWVAHVPEMPGTFSLPQRVSHPDMHHGTFVTHVPWCMPGLLTIGFLWSRWRGKGFRHPRCTRNQQHYLYGKRPMLYLSIHVVISQVLYLQLSAGALQHVNPTCPQTYVTPLGTVILQPAFAEPTLQSPVLSSRGLPFMCSNLQRPVLTGLKKLQETKRCHQTKVRNFLKFKAFHFFISYIALVPIHLYGAVKTFKTII